MYGYSIDVVVLVSLCSWFKCNFCMMFVNGLFSLCEHVQNWFDSVRGLVGF